MLFRIAGDSDAEIGRMGVQQLIVKVFSPVHADDLVYQFAPVGVPHGFGNEFTCGLVPVSPQGQHIFNAQEVQIDQCVFRILFGKSPTNQMWRSEEHTSELQSLMRISYAVFCLKKKKK